MNKTFLKSFLIFWKFKVFLILWFGILVIVSFFYSTVSFLYSAVSFLYFAVGFLYLTVVFFILPTLSLFCREFSLFCHELFLILSWVSFILSWFSLFYRCFLCSAMSFLYFMLTLFSLQWLLLYCGGFVFLAMAVMGHYTEELLSKQLLLPFINFFRRATFWKKLFLRSSISILRIKISADCLVLWNQLN